MDILRVPNNVAPHVHVTSVPIPPRTGSRAAAPSIAPAVQLYQAQRNLSRRTLAHGLRSKATSAGGVGAA